MEKLKKIIFIMMLPLISYANILELSDCTNDTIINSSKSSLFFAQDSIDVNEDQLVINKKLRDFMENRRDVYKNFQDTYIKEEKTTPSLEKIISKQCEIRFQRIDNQYFGKSYFISFLVPKIQYVPMIANRMTMEELETKISEKIIQAKKSGGTYLYPYGTEMNNWKESIKNASAGNQEMEDLKLIYKSLDDADISSADQLTKEEFISQSYERVLKKIDKTGLINQNQNVNQNSDTSKIFLHNLKMLKDDIEESTSNLINSFKDERYANLMGIGTTPEEERKLNEISKIQSTDTFKVTKRIEPFLPLVKRISQNKMKVVEKKKFANEYDEKCKEDYQKGMDSYAFSKKFGFNGIKFEPAKMLTIIRDNLSGTVAHQLQSIEDQLLYYTSDEFIIAVAVDKIIGLIAQSECKIERAIEKKTGIGAPSADLATNLRMTAKEQVKEFCAKALNTDAKATNTETTTADLCIVAIDFQCKLTVDDIGAMEFQGGGKEIDRSEKVKYACGNLNEEEILEKGQAICEKESKRRLVRDMFNWLAKAEKTLMFQLNKEDQCRSNKDTMFKLNTIKDKDQNMKETALAMVSNPKLGLYGEQLLQDIQGKKINTNAVISGESFSNKMSRLSNVQQKLIEEKNEQIYFKIREFNLKSHKFFEKLTKENPLLRNVVKEALYTAKSLFIDINIYPLFNFNNYLSLFLYQNNTDKNITLRNEVMKNFADNMGINIASPNALAQDVDTMKAFDFEVTSTNENYTNYSLIESIEKINKQKNEKIEYGMAERLEKHLTNIVKKDYIKRMDQKLKSIYDESAFIFLPISLEEYGINTNYNLPIRNVFMKTQKSMIGLIDVLELNTNNGLEQLPANELNFYFTENNEKFFYIDKLINQEKVILKERVLNSTIEQYERLIELYVKKVETMVLYETRINYGKKAYTLSNLIKEMSPEEKMFFEVNFYKMYDLHKY